MNFNCIHTEHALRVGDGRYGRYFEQYDSVGSWEPCGMTEEDAYELLYVVTSKNFNKDGMAIEWHPLSVKSWKEFEADVIELGFIPAYYMYDENVWGEGALYHSTQGHDARG